MNVVYQEFPGHKYLHVAALNGKDVKMVNSDLILNFANEKNETVIPAERFEFTAIKELGVYHFTNVPSHDLPEMAKRDLTNEV